MSGEKARAARRRATACATWGAVSRCGLNPNSAVQETDPTTASNSSPVSTVAGQVDLSRQLFEFSQPGFDAAITDDLSRAHASSLDVEIITGTASGGRTRGLLNWSGILSIGGTVTNAETFLASLWQAYSQLAGSSGYGSSDTSAYITVLAPRRVAWLQAGVSGTLPPGTSLVPGEVVISAGIPTALGAGTNEDVALVVEKSQVLLLSRGPQIRIREDILSSTLTVRVQATRDLAVLVKNASAIAKVTGLTPPSGLLEG
jgi:HK97 family phage major capsid protein